MIPSASQLGPFIVRAPVMCAARFDPARDSGSQPQKTTVIPAKERLGSQEVYRGIRNVPAECSSVAETQASGPASLFYGRYLSSQSFVQIDTCKKERVMDPCRNSKVGSYVE